MESLTIGKNVKKIGKNAFANCRKLKKVTVKSKKAPAKPAPTTPSAPVNPPAEPTATPTTAPSKTPVLSATSLSMRKGEYYQLSVQDPKHLPVWTSSNKNIAEVDSQGKVHAIKCWNNRNQSRCRDCSYMHSYSYQWKTKPQTEPVSFEKQL